MAKGNLKEMPIEVIQTTMRVQLSKPTHVSILTYCTLFLLINTWLVSLLSVFMGILLLQGWRPRTMLLTTSLVVRIQCSHHGGQTTTSGQEPKKPCFKPLQTGPPKITSRTSPTKKTNLNTKIQETKTVAEEREQLPSLPHIVFGDPNIHRILRIS